ncbi:polar-differentiation response regulator DivK [bacterium BMS3Abin07]|nr:polar-differentiation response regulator DivK [bacterium BMS3Abin07]HDZ62404.1 response regulator [Nitrospirota bacterium]
MTKRILVVEDNEKNRRLIRDILEYHGYEVLEAENGEVGIQMAREYKPDMILMDMQMPVMDGFTAISILKKDPATKGAWIIAVTSFAMAGDKERILAEGADDYISKPLNTRELPDKLKKFLG